MPALFDSILRFQKCYFASCFAIASFAQSSQQTVISFPPTVTLTPPSVISQSHTGHLELATIYLLKNLLQCAFCILKLAFTVSGGLSDSCLFR